MRSFNDYSNGPLFRKRSDKPGHGTNRAHYRTTYGGINPSVMRVDSDTDDKSSMQMWDSFLSGGQTLRFKKEKNKIEEKVEKEEHPLLSILQNAGIVDSVSTDSLFQDRSTAFLQENSKAKRFGVHGQFRRGGRPSSNGMRFSSSRGGGGGGGQPNYAPGAPQFSSPNYGSQPPSFASPRMTNYNMFQDQGQQQQQQQGEQLNIDSVQPDAFTGAGPSGGNPFGGNMPPPAAPSYEYSQISSGGRGGRPVPPPPPPTLPAMTRGKSPRPTAPSSPPSSSGGSMSSSSSSSSNSNLPPMSMGPFSAGTQKTSTKMPEMPAGIDVHFLPRFKETSTSFVHGAAAFKDGMHPTPPLPRTPPHG